MKKIVIVNHKCCLGEKNIYINSVIERIKEKFGTKVVFTEYAGHATEIAKDSSDYDLIIAAGGDGTISEIVNGMNLETQMLAIIPLGTGNSLARDLEISSPAQAVDIIEKNKLFKIDLISCEFKMKNEQFKKYGIATSGMGLAYETVAFARRCPKLTELFCYTGPGILRSFKQRVISAKLQVDNFSVKGVKFTNFLINNTKHGGNLRLFPKAKLNDSALDLLFIKTNLLTQHLWTIGLLTKTYFYYPGLQEPVNRLKIVLDEPVFFMLDGEILGPAEEVTYSVIPQKLRLLSQ